MLIGKGASALNGVVRSFGNFVVRGGRMRKRGGEVVSYAPQVAELFGSVSRAAMGVLLVGGTMAAAPAAMAGTCDSVTKLCSGAANTAGLDSPISLNIDGGTVTTATGFGFNNGNGATEVTGPALDINSTGSASFTDTHTSTIISKNAGIKITANDAVSVNAETNITAASGDAIKIVAGASGSGAVVAQLEGNVSGSANGLSIENAGTGGIWVKIVENADVAGGNAAILTKNSSGSGTTSISVDGNLNGGLFGVYAESNAYLGSGAAGNIIIENAATGVINGDVIGVYAQQNAGSFADITITNRGEVGQGTWGVGAVHFGTGNINFTNTGIAASVEGSANGVNLIHSQNGDIVVNNLDGAQITGGTNGIYAAHVWAGNVTITNSGTVTGETAVRASAAAGTVNLTNAATGVISGSVDFSGTTGAVNFTNNGAWHAGGLNSAVATSAISSNKFGSGNDTLNLNSNFNFNGSFIEFTDLETLNIGANFNLGNGSTSFASGESATAHTDGDVNFGVNSKLIVDANLTGADRLSAGGAVDLDGELVVNTLGSTAGLADTRYTVVSADEVTGEFTNDLIETSAFMAWEVEIDDDAVEIVYRQQRELADAALTPNQVATADGVDSLSYSNALRDALLHVADDATAQSAFNQLSGEIHPAVRTALTEDSRLPRNAVLDRLQDEVGGAIWGQIFGTWGENDASVLRNTHKLKRDAFGGILGVDLPVSETVRIGLAASYLEHDFSQNALNSKGSAKTGHVLGYLGAQSGKLNLKAGIGYGWGDVDSTRSINFATRGGSFSAAHSAKYDAKLLQAFGELGVRLPLGGGYVEPIANVAFVKVKTDGFTETGGASALLADKATEKSTISVIGARFSTAAAGAFSVRGLVGWQHGYGNLTPTSSLRFNGGERFSIAGVQQSRNAGVVNVEGNIAVSGTSSIGLGYDGVIGDQGQDHGAKLTLRIGF